jgi:hypothetical protein
VCVWVLLGLPDHNKEKINQQFDQSSLSRRNKKENEKENWLIAFNSN